jgi:hypothetical protein
MKSFALSTSTHWHTPLYAGNVDSPEKIGRESVIHVMKNKWIQAEWTHEKRDGTAGGGYSSSAHGGDWKWAVRNDINGDDVFEYWASVELCPYEVRFVTRIWACPACGNTSVEDVVGDKYQTLEECLSGDAGICGSPITVAPCNGCLEWGIRPLKVRGFLDKMFASAIGESAPAEEVRAILGYSKEAMNSIIAGDCRAVFFEKGQAMVHIGGFSEWLSSAMQRCGQRGEIRWMSQHYAPTRIAAQPSEDGFVEASFSSQGSGIYLLMQGAEVVYVGQSINVAKRIGAHIGQKDFDRALYLPTQRKDLNRVEAAYIKKFNPIYNKTLCVFDSKESVPRHASSLAA